MIQEVDLGVCRGHLFPGDSEQAVVLLPGASYSTQAPLLWFAREAAQAHGWTALQVWDEHRGGDHRAWAVERAEAALAYVGDVPFLVLVAKSLSSFAMPLAAERGLPGIWLTPLLSEPDVAEAATRLPSPSLLVGGTADPLWTRGAGDAAAAAEILEIEGADHALQFSGDPLRSLDALARVTEAIDRFLQRFAD